MLTVILLVSFRYFDMESTNENALEGPPRHALSSTPPATAACGRQDSPMPPPKASNSPQVGANITLKVLCVGWPIEVCTFVDAAGDCSIREARFTNAAPGGKLLISLQVILSINFTFYHRFSLEVFLAS